MKDDFSCLPCDSLTCSSTGGVTLTVAPHSTCVFVCQRQCFATADENENGVLFEFYSTILAVRNA